MNSIGFYGNLEVLTNRMAKLLLDNRDFCKYLYYDDDNPLSHDDISNPLGDLLDNKFFLQPKPSVLLQEQGIYVEMFLNGDNPQQRSGGLVTNYVVGLNLICHVDNWRIINGVRPYRILNIIDQTFNGKNISDLSIKNIIPLGSKFRKFADNYNGYTLNYILQWQGNPECYGDIYDVGYKYIIRTSNSNRTTKRIL